jgi:hypothetical protein
MKNKLLEGDLVEILNLTDYQMSEIISAVGNSEAHHTISNIIGMKFYISFIGYHDDYRLSGWCYGNTHTMFNRNQLRLLSRPVKNWVKTFVNK